MERPADVDGRQWAAYQRRLAQCPMFPELVEPPRTRSQQAEFRERLRRTVQEMLSERPGRLARRAEELYAALRELGVSGHDVWAATRTYRQWQLGEEYLVDALERLLRKSI